MAIQQTYTGETIDVDGQEFIKCTFQGCDMVYSGGVTPRMQNCELVDCRWGFDGAALRTIMFMTALYADFGEGGRRVMEETLENIRRGEHPS
jgi:hypothetical protein